MFICACVLVWDRRYKTLRLIHFFTAGEDEVKAWTIRVRYLPHEHALFGVGPLWPAHFSLDPFAVAAHMCLSLMLKP